MVLDSPDEEPTNETILEDEPAFQDEEEEYDSSAPYEPIIQTLDLPMGVDVLHLSFPCLPPALHRSSLPPLASNSILIAMACSDCTIRVMSIPLTPPSPRRKEKCGLRDSITNLTPKESRFGEKMFILSSGTMHQSIPKGVAISFTAASPEDPEDVDMEDEDEQSGRLPSSRHTSRSRSRSRLGKDQPWDLLVASHSADLSGLLLVHRIPLVAEGASLSAEMHIPWRVQHLASPTVSVDFSSALYPASQHSQLLVAEAKGSIRIFDCLPRSAASQGSWLASLYTDFETLHNALPRRKPILVAQWVLGGKAILVLQADGKWGIWNHEGRGPMPAEAKSFSQTKTVGLPTAFAIDGWVGTSSKSKPFFKSASTKGEGRSKFAPMTPSSRKMKQDALFTGPSNISDIPARGGLSVVPAGDTAGSRADDESILLWHGTTAIIIPSLFTHWQNRVRGSGNLFGSGAKGEPMTINNIHLGGERCNEINLLPIQQHAESSRDSPTQPKILVTGEKRLLIIAPPLAEPESRASDVVSPLSNSKDQQLLAVGELDVNGMDRILAGMSNGHTPRRKSQTSPKGRNLLSI